MISSFFDNVCEIGWPLAAKCGAFCILFASHSRANVALTSLLLATGARATRRTLLSCGHRVQIASAYGLPESPIVVSGMEAVASPHNSADSVRDV